MCASHYEQHRQGNELQPIKTDPATFSPKVVPIGTRSLMQAGYVRIKTEAGWVREHTQVMEDHLGRPLASDEMVHHRNGHRSDNRLDNLELCIKSQPPGQRVRDQVEWAKDILERYGDLVDRMLI